MKILVRTFTGLKLPLEIESWETLDELKQKIFEIEGIPPDQQSRLVFAGRNLGDGLIVDQIHQIQARSEHNQFLKGSIETSSTGDLRFRILLVIRLRGGGNAVFHRPDRGSDSDQSDCDSDDLLRTGGLNRFNEITSEEIEMEESTLVNSHKLIASTSGTPTSRKRYFRGVAESMLRRLRGWNPASTRSQQDGEPLGCFNNNSANFVEWELGHLENNQRFMSILQNSGLYNLRRCSYPSVDQTIIYAFAERWHPETNTFQLPFGEMTITLDDVSSILKIPVTGKAVSHLNNIRSVGEKQLLIYLLGVNREEAEEEQNMVGSNSVRLEWLKGKFSEVPNINDPSSSSIVYAARAYLLYLLGCTLFANKNKTVSVRYLHMLRDVDAIHTYSWGSACLSILYKQLGTLRPGEAQGYLTLVEAWIYEHIPFVRPHLNLTFTEDLPRVFRWICNPKWTYRSNGKRLRRLRRSLDLLRWNEVVWDPYQEHREHHPFQKVALYTGYIKCFDVISAYHPERVLRQFGFVQTIPSNPLPPISQRDHRGSNKFPFVFLDQIWERWDSHVLSLSARGERASQPWDAAPSYLYWYERNVLMGGDNLDKLKASQCDADPDGNVDRVECEDRYHYVDANKRIIQALEIIDSATAIQGGISWSQEEWLGRTKVLGQILRGTYIKDQGNQQGQIAET